MPINYREDPTYYNHVCKNKNVMGGAPICHVFTSLSRDVVLVYMASIATTGETTWVTFI